ncbi:MAG: hypothetical protein WC461_00545 [Candidatus Paceibacterota bacterium]
MIDLLSGCYGGRRDDVEDERVPPMAWLGQQPAISLAMMLAPMDNVVKIVVAPAISVFWPAALAVMAFNDFKHVMAPISKFLLLIFPLKLLADKTPPTG